MIRRIEIESLQSGQPRPYADSVYLDRVRFLIKMSDKIGWTVSDVTEETAKKFIRSWFNVLDDPEWHQQKTEYIKKIGSGEWEIKSTLAFTD